MIDSHRHQGLRKKMVDIIEAKGIHDSKVLTAISKVPRHVFLDQAFLEIAYENRAFPIGGGQTISHPYTVAYQTELLNINEGDKVLEIGTGSGYQTAVLAEMGAKVYTIERIRSLYEKTRTLLKTINYRKVRFFFGDGFVGLPDLAPFDKILITAAAPEIPMSLLKQLNKHYGVMVIPFGEGEHQQMLRIKRVGETDFEKETFDSFSFVPMLKGKVH